LLQEASMKINYYSKDDAEYFFPTIEHLKLFLHTIGLKKGEDANGSPAE